MKRYHKIYGEIVWAAEEYRESSQKVSWFCDL